MIEETRAGFIEAGVVDAVRDRDTATLFDWLIQAVSFQGIADTVAQGYIERHGSITAGAIRSQLAAGASCPKLEGYWAFHRCLYHKGSRTCAEPEHFDACPLPRQRLRNGRLNQTAFSLFLFLRDVIGGDLVGWIDRQLTEAERNSEAATHAAAIRQALVTPLTHVYGVSDKVLNMALSDLLLAADPERPRWVGAGAGMLAVDTLVHNWLHRTGILNDLGCAHAYGPACYRDSGCASVIELLSAHIDARPFNGSFPAFFPRFVQKAIWSFCAQTQLNYCNGNNIYDTARCDLVDCALFDQCKRVPLRNVRY